MTQTEGIHYRYERRARRPSSIVMIVAVWGALAALWMTLDLAWWIAATLAAFTLPALWDILRDGRSIVEVSPNRIAWQGALSAGARTDIDHVRLNRRFDGSVKILLVHIGGATTRLPPDIAPPVAAFEKALHDAGIASQRHPFSPL